LRAILFCIVILLIMQSHYSVPSSGTSDDNLLFQNEVYINRIQPTILNISSPGGVGYYGSFSAHSGMASLSIVYTSDLIQYFNSTSSIPLRRYVNSSTPHWEYPSYNQENISIVFEVFEGEEFMLQYRIFEDTTAPIILEPKSKRVSIYPPKYEIEFSFTGGFFSCAWISISNTSWTAYLTSNETRVWAPYRYEQGALIVLPDGSYNVTITAHDEFDRTTESYFRIKKTTDSSFLFAMTSILAISSIAIAIEIIRRRLTK
jgi:hypothetical protein